MKPDLSGILPDRSYKVRRGDTYKGEIQRFYWYGYQRR